MRRVVRAFVCAAAAGFGLSMNAVGGAQAAGAMAVGTCAAYGYAFDCASADAARTAAQAKCTGGQCRVVMMLRHSCAAFAIDGHQPCGPHG